MYINTLKLINFRNYNEINYYFPEKCIVLIGKNGIGKSNLLESIYLLCTGKSYKNSKRIEMINFLSNYFFIEGNFFFKNKSSICVSLGFGKDYKSSYLINNLITNDFHYWFGRRPVLSFSYEDINLVYGSPETRRKFLDFFGCYLDSSYLQNLLQYRYWLQLKNRLLCSEFNSIQCDLYDEKIAEYGTMLILKRIFLIEQLLIYFSKIYNGVFNSSESVHIFYNSSPDFSSSSNISKNVFYDILCANRRKDKQNGFSSIGPQRDDYTIYIDDKNAKNFCSQGQGRSLSLSLKLASGLAIETFHNENVLYLFDDTFSDLDSTRTENIFPFIKKKGQVFIAIPENKFSFDNDFYYLRLSS